MTEKNRYISFTPEHYGNMTDAERSDFFDKLSEELGKNLGSSNASEKG